jgi:1-aminocyclopropane-1-carboxylate deaminase/D-cysteine desulfhydrase-like pyridoxal-dependent ACC family enzyme
VDITPIDYCNNIFYKRDDLYTPFGKDHVNGGKVRQAVQLFDEIHDDIRDNHNGGVVTASSVHSPQSAIIAKVAQEHGFKCVVAVGGTKPETLYNHHIMRLTKFYGADIQIVAGHGMTTAIDAGAKKKVISKTGYKLIKFAISLESNPEAIFDGVTDQVANIPDELDNLVIPVGSGIQFAGIIRGLQKYNKKVKRIVGVAFCDRTKAINAHLDRFKYKNFPEEIIDFPEYELYLTKYPYSKSVWEKISDDFMLDDIYEGKAHLWMRENIDTKNEKTLFWVVGRRFTKEEVDNLAALESAAAYK